MPLTLASDDIRALRSLTQTLLSPSAFASSTQWQLKFVRDAMALLRADKGAIRLPVDCGFDASSVDVDPRAFAEYRDYYHKFDLGAPFGGPAVRRRVWHRKGIYGNNLAAFYKSEFFGGLIAPYQLHDAIGVSTLRELGPHATVLYLWHERRTGRQFGRRGLDFLRLLLPAFSAASEVATRYVAHFTELTRTIDSLTDACALYTNDSRLLHRNTAMRNLLAEPALSAPVMAMCDDSARQLAALSRHDTDVAWHRLGGGRCITPLAAFRARACNLTLDVRAMQPAIMVIVTRETPRLSDVELRDQFKMTQREVDVARQLAARRTNNEIARALGISAHTVRHHVEHVLQKLRLGSRIQVAAVLGDAHESGRTAHYGY